VGKDGETPELLLDRARVGGETDRGRLLELYRNYLRLIARTLVGRDLQARLDPSDLVQETFLKAHREFASFAGTGEPELMAWLRQILVRNLADEARRHRAAVRDHRRERSLEEKLDRSGLEVQRALAAHAASPSSVAARRERAVLLADAVACLPEDYREVFVLRALEHVPVEEIAARLGRSPGAVRMLWARAILRLHGALGESP